MDSFELCFCIRTQSLNGKCVQAKEKHPFLAQPARNIEYGLVSK